MKTYKQLVDKFYKLLWFASQDRDKDPNWIETERNLLVKAVNQEIRERGIKYDANGFEDENLKDFHQVTAETIKQGEVVGDPNYGVLLAHHCAEKVEGFPNH